MKRVAAYLISLIVVFNLCGCVALIAGAAGGVGTSLWLSNKLVREVEKPYETTVKAARETLEFLKLNITKETKKGNITQIMSKYYDGKTVWIDVHNTSAKSSRLEVRVGLQGDEESARRILDNILRRL